MTDAPPPHDAGKPTRSDSDFALIWRLLHDYLGKHLPTVVIAVICMIGSAAMVGALAWLLNPAVKQIFMERPSRPAVPSCRTRKSCIC